MPEVSRVGLASGDDDGALQSNSDFLDRLLGESTIAATPRSSEIQTPGEEDKNPVGIDKLISDEAADEVIREVLDQELLEEADIEEPEIIPLSDLSEDSEEADEVVQEIADSVGRASLPDDPASETKIWEEIGESSQRQQSTALKAESVESSDIASDESQEAEKAMMEILEGSDLETGAESRPEQDFVEQVRNLPSQDMALPQDLRL